MLTLYSNFYYNLNIFCYKNYYRTFCSFMKQTKIHKSTNSKKEEVLKEKKLKIGKYDYVGPPHKTANIRPFIFQKHENETPLETLHRQNREETQEWNITFWSHHNIKFEREKALFIEKRLREKYGNCLSNASETKVLSAEEMSMFYKTFLDQNLKNHLQYNKEWYKRNFRNLYLSFLVVLDKTINRRKQKNL